MGRKDFNRKQCIKALIKLGFIKKDTRRGSHDKYTPPKEILEKRQPNQPPFIMIPRSRKIHCQLEILKEVWAFGGDELIKEFEDLVK